MWELSFLPPFLCHCKVGGRGLKSLFAGLSFPYCSLWDPYNCPETLCALTQPPLSVLRTECCNTLIPEYLQVPSPHAVSHPYSSVLSPAPQVAGDPDHLGLWRKRQDGGQSGQ